MDQSVNVLADQLIHLEAEHAGRSGIGKHHPAGSVGAEALAEHCRAASRYSGTDFERDAAALEKYPRAIPEFQGPYSARLAIFYPIRKRIR